MGNPDSVQPDDPPWLKTAFTELGEREIAGRKSNPDIERFLQSTVVGPLVPVADEVPWCSAFVNFCMEQNGLKGTSNRLARSWLTWGRDTKQPTRGCVVVFDRPGGGPQAGHVASYLSGSPRPPSGSSGATRATRSPSATSNSPSWGSGSPIRRTT